MPQGDCLKKKMYDRYYKLSRNDRKNERRPVRRDGKTNSNQTKKQKEVKEANKRRDKNDMALFVCSSHKFIACCKSLTKSFFFLSFFSKVQFITSAGFCANNAQCREIKIKTTQRVQNERRLLGHRKTACEFLVNIHVLKQR